MKQLASLLFLCVALSAKAGGPWHDGHLKGYQELSYISDFNAYMNNQQWKSFTELGVKDRWTFKLGLPLVHMRTKPDPGQQFDPIPAGQVFGLGAMEFGVRYHLKTMGSFVHAVEIDAIMNAPSENMNAGLRTSYKRQSMQLQYLIGHSTATRYMHATPFVRINSNAYSEEIGMRYEIGKFVEGQFWIALYLEYLNGFKNGDYNQTEANTFTSTNMFNDQEHYLTINPKLIIPFKDQFGMQVAWIWNGGLGENWTNDSWLISLYYKW